MNDAKDFLGFTVGLILLMLLSFGILQWLHIPSGHFLDWLIGAASFWWLTLIVTVPWNLYFMARQVLNDAEQSQAKEITVDEQKILRTRRLARRTLIAAISLHLISAIALFTLSALHISPIGTVSSVAALLLTGLRPAIALYQHLTHWLQQLQTEFKYPREDLLTLTERVHILERETDELQAQFDPDNVNAWVVQQNHQFDEQLRLIRTLGQELETYSVELKNLRTTNQSEHQQLAREAQGAIAQISADTEFLNHVREIIRMVKTA